MKYVNRWCALFLFFSIIPFTHAGQYFQDFSGYAVGTTSFTDGSQLFSTKLGSVAGVQDANYKELQLTESNGGGLISAFELPDLDPSQTIYAFPPSGIPRFTAPPPMMPTVFRSTLDNSVR